MLQLQSFLGILFFIAVAFACSKNRSRIPWITVVYGIALQFFLGILVLGIPSLGIPGPLKFVFIYANSAILKVLSFTNEGTAFLLGDLADSSKSGLIIVFQILPIIIFLSSLMTVLYYLGVMQVVVNAFAVVMQRILKMSGAESLGAAANVFLGQTEAPLVIRPYLAKMTSSELFSLMVSGMATIAGSVMAAYVGFLKDSIPDIGGHLLTASILSAPAALMIAKIMIPETETPMTMGKVPKEKTEEFVNIIEAAAFGASEGMKLAANVAAMLLAFIALIALVNYLFISAGDLLAFEQWGHALTPAYQLNTAPPQLSLSLILSWLFKPFAFFIGVPLVDLEIASALIGEKIVFNEFIAYLNLAKLTPQITPRSAIILSYALCGFANFSSIAIQIGGIGPLVPERRKELAQFGIRAVIGGCLASFITACIAGILI